MKDKSQPVNIKPDAALFFYFPDGKCEHEVAVRAMDWALSVKDLDDKLRNDLKYGHKYNNADEVLEDLRNELHNILADRNISLEMIE